MKSSRCKSLSDKGTTMTLCLHLHTMKVSNHHQEKMDKNSIMHQEEEMKPCLQNRHLQFDL